MELRFRRLDEGARLPTRANAGDAGPRPLRGRAGDASARAEGGRASAPGSRSRSRPGTPGSSCRARASPRAHGIALVNAPGLIDSGYRGELRVLLLNTDPARAVRDRAGRPDRAAAGDAVRRGPSRSRSPGSRERRRAAASARRGAERGSQRRCAPLARALACAASSSSSSSGSSSGVEPATRARARARSGGRRARRSSAAAGRAGRCRSGCASRTPSKPSRAVVAVTADHPAERARAGAEVGAAAVVLEAGDLERAAAAEVGLDRDVADQPRAGLADRLEVDEAEAGDPLARRAGSCGRAAGSRRRRRARRRRRRPPRRARRAWSRSMSSATSSLVAVLAAADVDQVVGAGVEALAGAGGRRSSKPIPRHSQRRCRKRMLPRSA